MVFVGVERMEISDQDSHLALIVPTICIYKSLLAHLWDVYREQSSWSVMGVLAQGRGGEETHSLLSSVPGM